MKDIAEWMALITFGAAAMFFFLVIAAFVITAMRNAPHENAPVSPLKEGESAGVGDESR